MEFNINTKNVEDTGIVYVLQMELEGRQLVKIGMTSRTLVEDRVIEIIMAVFKKYRYFPSCYIKRYKTVINPLKVEKELHKTFKEFSFKPSHSFGGSTEFFNCPLQDVIEVYDALLDKKPAKKRKKKDVLNNN